MDIAILNVSPKGDLSVTLHYVKFLEEKFPRHAFVHRNVGELPAKMGGDRQAFDEVIDAVRGADAVVWATPVYFCLVPSPLLAFTDLVRENGVEDAFQGKSAAAITTSVHFFDHLAHDFLHAQSEDFGMAFRGSYSAGMTDLLSPGERERFLAFFRRFLEDAGSGKPVARAFPPLPVSTFRYVPGSRPGRVDAGSLKVVVVAEPCVPGSNLGQMVGRVAAAFGGNARVFPLDGIDIRGGCLGCIRCGYDNTCVYRDGFADFFRDTICSADILVFATRLHGRSVAPRWKMFMDRSFFRGHTPALAGKQIAWLVEGPLTSAHPARELLAAWAECEGAHARFVSDEVADSAALDALLDTLCGDLARDAREGYVPPPTFRAVAGKKLFRDLIYGPIRIAFPADYRYYREHGLFDFPQNDWKVRLFNAFVTPLMAIPPLRREVQRTMKERMVEPLRRVLAEA